MFGKVGIDGIAGPSDVLILADDSADPGHVALDLLAQAEHDETTQVLLITDSATLAQAVDERIEAMLPGLRRENIVRASLDANGALIVVGGVDDMVRLADLIAAEHLQIMTRDPASVFARVRHAGSVFFGDVPTAIGDYIGGTNHVLPTGGTARFASGLSVHDFLKRTTWSRADSAGMAAIGPSAALIADAEGLYAHASSLRSRFA